MPLLPIIFAFLKHTIRLYSGISTIVTTLWSLFKDNVNFKKKPEIVKEIVEDIVEMVDNKNEKSVEHTVHKVSSTQAIKLLHLGDHISDHELEQSIKTLTVVVDFLSDLPDHVLSYRALRQDLSALEDIKHTRVHP